MQARPANWETLLADLNHKTEYRYVINGVEYTGAYVQGVPAIEKPMMLQPVIGRCCTGSFTITVRSIPNVTIPKAAPVSVYCRLVGSNGVNTDWVPQGMYWITKRSGYGELVTLTCRDNMILAGRTYTDKTQITEWPAPMDDVFAEIVALMNVPVDPRTIIHSGPAYKVDYPNDDALMSEILSMIAAAHGGNFIMTESGAIRLVPFPATDAPVFALGQAYSDYTPYSTGIKTISRVTITDDAENTFTNGDDTGVELTGVCNYCTQLLVDSIANGARVEHGTLYANGTFGMARANLVELGTLNTGSVYLFVDGALGKRYTPYQVSGAYFDPCIELGDTFTLNYRGETLTLIANSITVDCTQGYYCTVENGVQEDDEEEIPYVSPADLQAKRYLSTGKSYFGNRINRTEGFVSEYRVDDIAVARLIANSNLFTMQRMVDGNWENVLYFNPVDRQYHFTGEVTIDTSRFAASSAVVDNPSIVLTADRNGVVGASTHVINVIAYTGDEPQIPIVSSVSGLPTGMSYSIGTAGANKRLPITLTVAAGSNLGSADSIDGTFKITVTSPVSMDINVNWAKVNTGVGTDGYSTANVVLYQRSSSTPAVPSAALTYDFSSGEITGSIGNWTRDIPTGTNPCYATFAIVSSRETTVQIISSDWSTPSIVAQNGENGSPGTNGYNTATVVLYQRSATQPTLPASSLTYTFSSGALTGTLGNWSRTIPTGSDPCYTTFAVAKSRSASVSIAASAWSAATILAQNGENGAPGDPGTNGYNTANVFLYQRSSTAPSAPNTVLTYDFTSGAITGSLGNWQRTIPTGSNPCYTTLAVVTSQSTSVEIPASAWSAVTIMAQNGENGAPGTPGTPGTSGYNTANVILYQRASARPNPPSTALQYTFATGALSGSLGSWQRTIPTGDDPCYATFALVTSQDASVEIPASTWSTASVIVQDGEDGQPGQDGYNTAIIFLYKRVAEAVDPVSGDPVIPDPPANDLVYTFATAALSGNLSGWSRNIPATDGNPCWCVSAQAYAKTSAYTLKHGDISSGGAWSDAVKIVEDGMDGDPGSITYAQATAPTPATVSIPLREGDLWIDTSDGNGDTLGNQSLYRWDGSQWVSVQDLNIPAIITALTSAQSRLDVLDTQISATVDATYVSNQLDAMLQQFNSTLEQTAKDLTATFNTDITAATGAVDTKYSAYIRASGDGVELGRSDSALKCLLNNTRLSFVYTSGNSSKEVAYFSNDKLFITYAQITDELIIGSENDEYGLFKWERTRTGLGLKYVSV